jgi:hypothetical protein
MEPSTFVYHPGCSMPECGRSAVYKVAAVWSDGTSRELKTYGLACEAHRDDLLELAQAKRQALRLAEGETVEPVGLYQLLPGVRDKELSRVG